MIEHKLYEETKTLPKRVAFRDNGLEVERWSVGEIIIFNGNCVGMINDIAQEGSEYVVTIRQPAGRKRIKHLINDLKNGSLCKVQPEDEQYIRNAFK